MSAHTRWIGTLVAACAAASASLTLGAGRVTAAAAQSAAEPPSATTAPAAKTSKTIWDGVYTAAQATRGQQQYMASCAQCHAEDLLGTPGPPLVGEAFLGRWAGATADDMFQTIRRTMPQTAPDSLGQPVYADVVSFLLQGNAATPGANELPTDPALLRQILVTPRAGSR